jgi:RNA polymerase sigma-70 factor (ECF subfamily)
MALRADDVDLGRDRALVERFQAGDAAGFEDLYRRYYSRLYRFCLKRVGDTTEAEEVTQEAFARAYAAMPRLAGERRFYPWISVIAARLCSDTHRRRARSIPLPELDLGSVEGAQESEVLAAEDRAHLAAAMDRLGPRHREVLHLREQQGWSYQRIAEYYDVSLGTVEQLLWRARRALRREFEAVAGPDARGLAALPAIAWILRRLTSVRARLEGWSQHAMAPLANNAVSMVVAVTGAVVLAGGVHGPTPATAQATPAPPAVVRIGTVSANTVAPARDTGPSTRPAIGTGAAAAAPAGEDPGLRPVGPVLVGSNESGKEESADHPVQVQAADTWVSANPNAVLEAIQPVLGGAE